VRFFLYGSNGGEGAVMRGGARRGTAAVSLAVAKVEGDAISLSHLCALSELDRSVTVDRNY
jgi:hypothetical protein